MDNQQPNMISRSRLAIMLGVSHTTIKKWIAKGKLPKPVTLRGRPMFDLNSIGHIVEPIITARYILNP